jgi:hypothetical protein
MPVPYPKIATCCYCGTRAALVLRGENRHELSCASCGAPLHDLKGLKASAEHRPTEVRRETRRDAGWAAQQRRPAATKKGKKRRKSMGQRLFSEAFDLIEDIFD